MTTLLENDKVAISRAGTAYSATLGDVALFAAEQGGGGGALARQPGDVFLSFDLSPPTDSVELNGALIPDGAVDFPIVAARYPFMVSGTDLVLPDLRGRVVRGWDHGAGMDPDAAGRLPRAGDGAGGDLPGTTQDDALAAHDHAVYRRNTFVSGGTMQMVFPHSGSSSLDTTTGASGGAETRPVNVAMMFFMALG